MVSEASAQTVWRVRADAPPGGDGLSWASAFDDLQDALAAAHSQPLGVPQEIWIGPGAYSPDSGSGDRLASFVLDRPIALRGGFAGVEITAAERDANAPKGTLTGEIGAPDSRSDNSLHVVVVRDGTAQSVFERVVIRRGAANDANQPNGRSGGGVLVEDGSPTFVDCLITECTARDGGGMYAIDGEPVLESTVVRDNTATNSGGGAYLSDGGRVVGSTINGNTAPSGAGVFICCGSGEIRDSVFQSNFGTNGGGMFLGVASPAVTRCAFVSNSAQRGSGVYSSSSTGVFASCRFASNSASEGGGIYFDLGATAVNCVFTRNSAFSFGGAIYARNNPTIVGCTIYGNGAGFLGGGVYHASGTTTLANSILWANTDSSGISQAAQVTRSSGTLAPVACCVEGWDGALGGTLNVGAAPKLAGIAGVDGLLGTVDDDPSLASGSACIDAGDNTRWPPDLGDLDGDGDTIEPTPLDVLGSARALDDPGVPDGGAPGNGLPAIADIGAAEFLPGCVGDINGDAEVNSSDFSILAGHFGVTNATYIQGDINGDGLVNSSDFTLMASRFGSICP